MSDRILPLPAYIASLAPRDLADARRLVALVPEGATAIEMRLDLCREPIAAVALLALDARPIIVRDWPEGHRPNRQCLPLFASKPEEAIVAQDEPPLQGTGWYASPMSGSPGREEDLRR